MIDNISQNIVNNIIITKLGIDRFFTISTGIAPNNNDGITNINIILNNPVNAPP